MKILWKIITEALFQKTDYFVIPIACGSKKKEKIPMDRTISKKMNVLLSFFIKETKKRLEFCSFQHYLKFVCVLIFGTFMYSYAPSKPLLCLFMK